MKRSVAITLLIVLSFSLIANASSWNWWSQSTGTLNPTPSGSNVLWWWPKSISQPTQPTQPQQPGEPIEPVNPGKPSQPTQPSQPSQPVNPSEPIRNVQRPSPALTASERYIIEEVNKERTSRGLQPLEVDMQLVKVAKEKSYDMAAYAYFSHVSPTYGTVFSMLADYGVSYQRAGENIARAGSVSRAQELFMDSSGHRANILSAGYTHIGVGIVQYGRSYYVTQVFIRK